MNTLDRNVAIELQFQETAEILEREEIIVLALRYGNHSVGIHAERILRIGLRGGQLDRELAIVGNLRRLIVGIDSIVSIHRERTARAELTRADRSECAAVVACLTVKLILLVECVGEDRDQIALGPEQTDFLVNKCTSVVGLEHSVEVGRILQLLSYRTVGIRLGAGYKEQESRKNWI